MIVSFKSHKLQVDSSIGLRLLMPERINVESVLKDADTAIGTKNAWSVFKQALPGRRRRAGARSNDGKFELTGQQ